MKFEVVLLAAAGSALAADSSDVAFLTRLVNDYKSNGKSYINFLATANSVPPELTSLAREVGTYTDDSYTTLLDNSQLDITELQSFATELPWYSRIAVGGADAASGSEADASESGSQASDSESASAAATSDSSAASSASESASSSESSGLAGSKVVAPVGVFLGALAVVLL